MGGKVSVIITTCGRNDFIRRSLDSVCMQTYDNIEIIVVDDNNENSKEREFNIELLKKDKYKNIIYIKHKMNLNGAVARNTGIMASSGDYITFLDDDDLFLPTRIEKCVEKLEQNKEIDCVYTNTIMIDEHGPCKIKCVERNIDYQEKLLCHEYFFGTGSNIFLKRKIIDSVGLFNENFYRHQDLEYMIRVLGIHKISGIEEFLVIKDTRDKRNHLNPDKLYESRILLMKTFKTLIANKNIKKIIYANFADILIRAQYEKNHEIKNECLMILKRYKIYSRRKIACKLIRFNIIMILKKNKKTRLACYIRNFVRSKYVKQFGEIMNELEYIEL